MVGSVHLARSLHRTAAILMVLSAISSCAPSAERTPAAEVGRPAQSPQSAPSAPEATAQTGIASWYDLRVGHRTASGERFDPRAMTAAHRTLPFGTLVRVTNLANGRTITVEITDRGPQDRSRVIDVSRGAAEALGFTAKGVTPVKLEQVISSELP